MKYRLLSGAVVLLFFLLFQAGHRDTLAAETRPADLTVFFSSDTRGMLRRCGCSEGQLGGVSARATYIKNNRPKGNTLVLDAGDTLFDGLSVAPERREFYALKTRTLLSAMKLAGYDAALVGEYDLAYGPDFLAEAGRETGFPFLASNVLVEKHGKRFRPFKASVVRRFPGMSVGVIGVVDSRFPYKSFPGSFGGVGVSDTAVSARAGIRKIRGKADIIIVLAHMSVSPVEGLAKAVPDADIIIQGHSQEMLEEPVRVGDTVIVKGFNKGKHIGRLDVWLGGKKEPGGHGRLIEAVKYSVIALDESIPPDPSVEAVIAGYRERLKEKAFTFVKDTPGQAAAGGDYTGPVVCKGCHAEAYRNWSGTGHASAFSTLVRTNDQYDPECLPCHTTGYDYVSGYNIRTDGPELRGVTCESCHGRGGAHAGGNPPAAADIVTGKAVDEGVCLGCHDDYNSPKFQYEEYKARGGAHRGGTGL